MNQHLYAQQTNINMKNAAAKNNKKGLNKFENFVLTPTKKKNVKGGSDPIIIEDVVNG